MTADPLDWNQVSENGRACILALSFRGQIELPKNLPVKTYKKALRAFNANRKNFETEEEAIREAIGV